jgi:hypothetical protein
MQYVAGADPAAYEGLGHKLRAPQSQSTDDVGFGHQKQNGIKHYERRSKLDLRTLCMVY